MSGTVDHEHHDDAVRPRITLAPWADYIRVFHNPLMEAGNWAKIADFFKNSILAQKAAVDVVFTSDVLESKAEQLEQEILAVGDRSLQERYLVVTVCG